MSGKSTADDDNTKKTRGEGQAADATPEDSRVRVSNALVRLVRGSGDQDRRLGTTIDRRQIRKRLGEDEIGVLYEARHEILARSVALKVVHRAHSEDEALVAAFSHDAAQAASLTSAYAVPIADVGRTDDGCLFYSRPLLDGERLSERLARGPLTVDETLTVARQIGEVLIEMHERELVHRALEPYRVYMIDSVGRSVARVLDVGCARLAVLIEDGDSPYRPPEQKPDREPQPTYDIYALAAMVFEMLTGLQPDGETRDPRVIDADLPARLCETIIRALDPDPDKRPSSVVDLLEGLVADTLDAEFELLDAEVVVPEDELLVMGLGLESAEAVAMLPLPLPTSPTALSVTPVEDDDDEPTPHTTDAKRGAAATLPTLVTRGSDALEAARDLARLERAVGRSLRPATRPARPSPHHAFHATVQDMPVELPPTPVPVAGDTSVPVAGDTSVPEAEPATNAAGDIQPDTSVPEVEVPPELIQPQVTIGGGEVVWDVGEGPSADPGRFDPARGERAARRALEPVAWQVDQPDAEDETQTHSYALWVYKARAVIIAAVIVVFIATLAALFVRLAGPDADEVAREHAATGNRARSAKAAPAPREPTAVTKPAKPAPSKSAPSTPAPSRPAPSKPVSSKSAAVAAPKHAVHHAPAPHKKAPALAAPTKRARERAKPAPAQPTPAQVKPAQAKPAQAKPATPPTPAKPDEPKAAAAIKAPTKPPAAAKPAKKPGKKPAIEVPSWAKPTGKPAPKKPAIKKPSWLH